MLTYRMEVPLNVLLATFLLPFTISFATATRLTSHSVKHLEKRPNHPLTRECSRDFGNPDYSNCRLAIAQLPTWTSYNPSPASDAACLVGRLFRERTTAFSGIENVQLPLRRTYGSCTVLISGIHSLEELDANDHVEWAPSDLDNWWSLIDAAYQINSQCVGAPGTGGQQLAGENSGIQVAIYEREVSRIDTAVNHWLGEDQSLRAGDLESNREGPFIGIKPSNGHSGSVVVSDGSSMAISNEWPIYCIPRMGRNCIIGMICKPLVVKVSKFLMGVARTIVEMGFCGMVVWEAEGDNVQG